MLPLSDILLHLLFSVVAIAVFRMQAWLLEWVSLHEAEEALDRQG